MVQGYHKLIEWANDGGISPIDLECFNPASVDLRLGDRWINIPTSEECEAETITMFPGLSVLATTIEYVKIPLNYSGLLFLKSSSARLGLDHALAGWIDPGFEGQLTLEIHAHRVVSLTHKQRVIQLVLMRTEGAIPYKGRYLHQTGPTPFRVDID
jgi:dCTP deaminase